jgi:hypothetical protein
MATPITLSQILQFNNVNPQVVYNLAVEGLEIERCKLESYAAIYNAVGYSQSLERIQQYYRLLSIFRGDTLNSITGREQSSN